jgi:hypothetical protein
VSTASGKWLGAHEPTLLTIRDERLAVIGDIHGRRDLLVRLLHAVRLFFQWMADHQLGRKRLLDTLLAATYSAAGITSIVSTNARDSPCSVRSTSSCR